jgi:CRP/FNR family transcriptional regulator, cyclic AMP receptor protein
MSAELLKKIYLFEGLSMPELVEVLKICGREEFEKDKFIFLEGDLSDKCYIIAEGRVRISKYVPNVGEKDLAELRRGSYFGEMALIDGAPRSASAIANEPTSCLVLEKAGLDRLIDENKETGNKILRSICRTLSKRLRESNDRISGLMTEPSGAS